MIKLTLELDEDQIKDYVASLIESEHYSCYGDIELTLNNKDKTIKVVWKG